MDVELHFLLVFCREIFYNKSGREAAVFLGSCVYHTFWGKEE